MLALVVSGCTSNSKGNDAGAASKSPETTAPASASSGSSESSDKPPERIAFLNGDFPKDTEEPFAQYKEFEKIFKEKYPNVDIKSENFNYDVQTFLPLAVSGQLPNLFSTWFTEPAKIIKGGYAADITDVLKEYGYDQAINPSLLSLVQKDGRTFGVPSSGYNVGMWYNMKLFEQAGLLDADGAPIFPQTYEELVQTAVKIKEKTGKAGFFFPTKNNQGGWLFSSLAWSYGVEFVEQSEDGKWKAVFNSQAAVDAMNLLKDMKWKHNVLQENVLADVSDMFRLFGTDQVAMSFGLAEWMNIPVNDYKMSKDNMAMSRTPSGPDGRYSLTGGGLFMFSAGSSPEQVKAGLDWLKIRGFSPAADPEALSGFEASLKQDNELGRIVGPGGLKLWVNEDRLAGEQAIREKYTNVDMALWNDYINNEGVTLKPEVPVNAQELYKALDSVIQAVLTDKNANVQRLLDQAAADFQKDYLDKQG